MCVTADQKWTTREKKPQFSSIYQTRKQGEAEVLLTDVNSFFVHYEVIKESVPLTLRKSGLIVNVPWC